MQVSFLIRGNETRRSFEEMPCPAEVARRIGAYQAEGDSLFVVSFETESNSLHSARDLARVRDAAPSGAGVHNLRDDASAKFGTLLYPGICEFERSIRSAYTIAMCAARGQFDDELVAKLEQKLHLGTLRDQLLHDDSFLKAARARAQSVTKDELIAAIASIEENSTWNVLFGAETMPAAKDAFGKIVALRNAVMHFHTISEQQFDNGRTILKRANHEVHGYINGSLSDVDYPKRKAPDAREALAKMNEGYISMVTETSKRILESLKDSGALDSMNAAIEAMNRGSLANISEQLKSIQAPVLANFETLAAPSNTVSEYLSRVAIQNSQMKELQERIAESFVTPELTELQSRLAENSTVFAANSAMSDLANSVDESHFAQLDTLQDSTTNEPSEGNVEVE